MEISHSLSATAGLVIITNVVLLIAFLLKKKRKDNSSAYIFECGENPTGSATRQYRVEFIYSMIENVVLLSMMTISFYWIVELIEKDSMDAFIGAVITTILWFLTYMYMILVGVKE